jgi:hypothetical protein
LTESFPFDFGPSDFALCAQQLVELGDALAFRGVLASPFSRHVAQAVCARIPALSNKDQP